MSRVFADTSFFLALLNPNDSVHQVAVKTFSSIDQAVTSDWVVAELGNGLSSVGNRQLFVSLLRRLRSHSSVEIIAANRQDLDEAIELFAHRPDKEWSLVDCTSFVLMTRMNIGDSLTSDRHFRQAGFNALLL